MPACETVQLPSPTISHRSDCRLRCEAPTASAHRRRQPLADVNCNFWSYFVAVDRTVGQSLPVFRQTTSSVINAPSRYSLPLNSTARQNSRPACSAELSRRLVNRLWSCNVYRCAVYITARSFLAIKPCIKQNTPTTKEVAYNARNLWAKNVKTQTTYTATVKKSVLTGTLWMVVNSFSIVSFRCG